MRLLDRAVEICANDVAIEIADDEQRWVQQRLPITKQLLVSCIEVFLFTLVFPSETAALPNVRKTTLALGLRLFCYAVGLCEREELFVFDDALLKTNDSFPIGSAAAGVGWPSIPQRSLKCS